MTSSAAASGIAPCLDLSPLPLQVTHDTLMRAAVDCECKCIVWPCVHCLSPLRVRFSGVQGHRASQSLWQLSPCVLWPSERSCTCLLISIVCNACLCPRCVSLQSQAAVCSEQARCANGRCPKLVSVVLCQVQLMEPSAAEERNSALGSPAAKGLQALAIVDRTFKDLDTSWAGQPRHLRFCPASWLADILQNLPSLR